MVNCPRREQLAQESSEAAKAPYAREQIGKENTNPSNQIGRIKIQIISERSINLWQKKKLLDLLSA